MLSTVELERVRLRACETKQPGRIDIDLWLMECGFDGRGWAWANEEMAAKILPSLSAPATVLSRSAAGGEVLARVGLLLEEGDDVQQALRKLRAASGMSVAELTIDKGF